MGALFNSTVKRTVSLCEIQSNAALLFQYRYSFWPHISILHELAGRQVTHETGSSRSHRTGSQIPAMFAVSLVHPDPSANVV